MESVFNDSDFLVVLTEWKEFKNLSDADFMKLRDKNVFDGRIRVLNGEMIAHLIDNNEGFWKNFSDIITNTVLSRGVDKLSEIYSNKIKNIK
jgi:hypothetical protein